MASILSFARNAELDVIVIDSDSVRCLFPVSRSDATIVLLTETSDARSISHLLRNGVRAIIQDLGQFSDQSH